MKFLELHFNPNVKKNKLIFDTFYFVPETREEDNLGCLCLAGELKEPLLPKNKEFISELAEIIKEEYYKLPKRKIENSFKECLEKANKFLEIKIKRENTSWLGKLNFAALSIGPDLSIRFSKFGKLKIFLLRQGEIFDITENMIFNISADKAFANIVEGSVKKGEKLLIVSENVFDIFKEEGIFESLVSSNHQKEIKKLFKDKKEKFKQTLGFSFLIIPRQKKWLRRKLYFSKLPFFKFIYSLEKRSRKNIIAIIAFAAVLLFGWLFFKHL